MLGLLCTASPNSCFEVSTARAERGATTSVRQAHAAAHSQRTPLAPRTCRFVRGNPLASNELLTSVRLDVTFHQGMHVRNQRLQHVIEGDNPHEHALIVYDRYAAHAMEAHAPNDRSQILGLFCDHYRIACQR